MESEYEQKSKDEKEAKTLARNKESSTAEDIDLQKKWALFAIIKEALANTKSSVQTDFYQNVVARTLTNDHEIAYIVTTKNGEQQTIAARELLQGPEGFKQLRLDREYYQEHLSNTYDDSKKHIWLAIANFKVVAEGMDQKEVYTRALQFPTVLAPKMVQVGPPIKTTKRR